MTKVLVSGGGVAGIAAAISASMTGAQVTLAERSGTLAQNRCLLPSLLSGAATQAEMRLADPCDLSERFGIEVRLGEHIVSVDSASGCARTRRGCLTFDSIVLATGSVSLPDDLKGASKHGVAVMRSVDDYLGLSEALGGVSHLALIGTLPVSLLLAQAIAGRCRVSVFLGSGTLPQFTRRVLGRVSEAASPRGVRLFFEPVDSIVGVRRAEAVVAAGAVHPCDGVAIVPRTAPSLPSVGCARGGNGGALVDESLRTSCRGVFAAGDCAELRCGSGSLPSRLHSSSIAMGEAAGVNAAGGTAKASVSRCIALELFGVELCEAGLDVRGARRLGLDAVEFESHFGEGELETSLVYDRVTRRLYGVRVAGRGALSLSGYASLAVSSGARLDDLAYQESPCLSRLGCRRSPISLTAGWAIGRSRGGVFGEPQGPDL